MLTVWFSLSPCRVTDSYAESHSHTGMTEVFYVLKGCGTMELNDPMNQRSSPQQIPLVYNKIISVPPLLSHAIKNICSDNLEFLILAVADSTSNCTFSAGRG